MTAFWGCPPEPEDPHGAPSADCPFEAGEPRWQPCPSPPGRVTSPRTADDLWPTHCLLCRHGFIDKWVTAVTCLNARREDGSDRCCLNQEARSVVGRSHFSEFTAYLGV